MGWRENLRQSSFRDAIFFVDSIDGTFGRRVVTHEYPQRDDPYSEDLGRRARQFTVSAYLVGIDYQLQRDALIEACELPGAGQLVHPYMGTLTVVCTGVTVRERRQDGGYCEISLSFTEDGKNQFPAAIANNSSAVSSAADALQAQASTDFVDTFDILGTPEFVREELAEVGNTLTAPFDSLIATATDLATDVLALRRDMLALMNEPEELADRFLGTIRRVTASAGSNKSSSKTLRDLTNSGQTITDVPQTTGTRVKQATAQSAMVAMVEQMALAEQARVTVDRSYDSYQEAVDARAAFGDDLDAKAETASDDAYVAMTALRAKVMAALPDPKLPEVQTIRPRQTIPAIVLAYQLHGDPERDTDIVDRNNVNHPGFLPGGQPLEVVIGNG